ncbi:MAG TPA: hypothetical protein VK486_17305, partial [Thermoleophilaceae bacterium]|nr:hypothetical protein [Thermoleophilaceae bacterium]
MSKAKAAPFHVIPKTRWGGAPGKETMEDQAPPTEAFLHYSDTVNAAVIDTEHEAFRAARNIQM